MYFKKGEIKDDKRWSERKQACVGFSLVYIASLGDAEMKFDVGVHHFSSSDILKQ